MHAPTSENALSWWARCQRKQPDSEAHPKLLFPPRPPPEQRIAHIFLRVCTLEASCRTYMHAHKGRRPEMLMLVLQTNKCSRDLGIVRVRASASIPTDRFALEEPPGHRVRWSGALDRNLRTDAHSGAQRSHDAMEFPIALETVRGPSSRRVGKGLGVELGGIDGQTHFADDTIASPASACFKA